MENRKSKIFIAILVVVLCLSVCIGLTYAYFTDSAKSSGNKIQAGNLKLDLQLYDKVNGWQSIKNSEDPIFNYEKWEPGYVDAKLLKIENLGDLAMQWEAKLVSTEAVSAFANAIEVYVKTSDSEFAYPVDRAEALAWTKVGTLDQFINTANKLANGTFTAQGEAYYIGIAFYMPAEIEDNTLQGQVLGAFDIQINATQYTHESDAFGSDYDEDAKLPCDHHNTEIIADRDATCEDTGLTKGKKCSDCDMVLVQQEVIDSLPHTPGTWVVDVEPTYNADGIKSTQCTVCGANMQETMTSEWSREITFRLSTDRTYYIASVNNGYLNGELWEPITEKNIVIPATHQGIPVKECSIPLDYDSCVQSVTIPPSIEKLAVGEKYGLILYITDLEAWMNVDFANRVPNDYMGYDGNRICLLDENGNQVKDLVLPEGMVTIEDGMFANFMVNSIQIPSTVTSIGNYAFFATYLQSITIPEGVTSIGDYAFAETSLQSVIIPKDVTSMGDHVFTKWESEITIFCEAEAASDGWKPSWNLEYYSYDSFPVVWGWTGEEYTYTFESNQGTSFENITSSVRIELPVPTREGFDFAGWYDNVDLIGTAVTSPYYSAKKHTLYAKWIPEKEGESLNNPIIMEQGVACTVDVTEEGQTVYYSFTPETSGTYTFKAESEAPTDGNLYNSELTLLAYSENWMDWNFSISHELIAGNNYYLEVQLYNVESDEYWTGSVTITVTADE